jgi:cytochrome c5
LIDFESRTQKLNSGDSIMAVKRASVAAILTVFLLPASVQAEDLPDGAGKELVTKVCTVCHEVDRIVSKRKTKEEWNDTVDKMAARGAMASDEEFTAIVTYLAKYLGKN